MRLACHLHLRIDSDQVENAAVLDALKVSRLEWTSGNCLKGVLLVCVCVAAWRLCVELRCGDASRFSQYGVLESPSGAKNVTLLTEPFMHQSIHTALPTTKSFHTVLPPTSTQASQRPFGLTSSCCVGFGTLQEWHSHGGCAICAIL